MLADVPGVGLENFAAAHWTFANWLLACEINFNGWLFRFSFSLRFWIPLLEFEADVFLIRQHEKRFERPALSGNESFKQISFPGREQFLHLFALDRSLQDHFAGSEIADLVWAD